MRVCFNCESSGDADKLHAWIEQQEICTVEVFTDPGDDRDSVYITIEPFLAPRDPEGVKKIAASWALFVFKLLQTGFCY